MSTSACDRLAPLPSSLLDARLLPTTMLGFTRATTTGVGKVSTRAEPIILGEAGSCPGPGSLLHVVFDQSPSVTDDGGADPLSRRHEETALAIRHVARACRCRRERIRLMPFDAESVGGAAALPLTRHGLRVIEHGLKRLAGTWGMSSQLGPALDRIETDASRPDEQRAVVVFSDFLLTDPNPAGVLRRLCGLPGYKHAVVLGAHPPSVLINDPSVAVTRLTPSSPRGDAARAVFDGLTRYRTLRTTNRGGSAHHHEIVSSEGELIT